MARIKQITSKNEISDEHHGIFDSIASSRGRISGPFSVLLHSPEIAGRAAHLGAYIRFESLLEDDEREVAIITAAREMNCNYEWAGHVPIAIEAGVAPNYSLIIRYARQLINDKKVDQETFEQAVSKYGEQGVTELTAAIGYYGMLAYALNVFEVTPESGKPTLI
jgi:4-carboxymuconolactone decarboxylase